MIKSQLSLPEAFPKKFCPLCRLTREAEERLVWFLLYESTGDPKLRAEWDTGKGFCKYHNSLIKMTILHGRLISGSSVARIYETILDGYQSELQELAKNSLQKDFSNNIQCYFCHKKEEIESNNIALLLELLQSPGGIEKYKSSDGLCNSHFMLAISRLNKKESKTLREFLVNEHISRLEKLKNHITELQRKERYDVSEPATREEKASWIEILWRFGGVEYDHMLIWEKSQEKETK